jgi:poly(hydroxyalkanoate) depolymerase family esterase
MKNSLKLGMLLVALVPACASNGDAEAVATSEAPLTASVTAVTGFGSNPGALAMYKYVPAGLPQNSPLVVLFHGCTQSAAEYAQAGWTELADKWRFALVLPEQSSSNNPIRCFNWAGEYGDPTNLKRGEGENLSVKQMVDKMRADHQTDPNRTFVAGFSSGGAEAALMLAVYPDVFKAGAVFSGVPYYCGSTQQDAYTCMNPGKNKSPQEWGDLVRGAYPGFSGPYPRVAIWHGTSDTTVATANQGELIEQWTNVHGLPATPSATNTINGYPHREWRNGSGTLLVEAYDITGMGHSMPIDVAGGCGTAIAYMADKKICGAYHAARFFGLDNGTADAGIGAADATPPSSESKPGWTPGAPNNGASGGPSGGSNGGAHGGAPGERGADSVCACRSAGLSARSSLGATAFIAAIAALFVRRRRAARAARGR